MLSSPPLRSVHAAMPLSLLVLILCLCLLFQTSSSRSPGSSHRNSINLRLPQSLVDADGDHELQSGEHPGTAERLIRALNLIPSEHLPPPGPIRTTAMHSGARGGQRLHEKKVTLNVSRSTDGESSAVSVEELGLHAGYFDLNRTHSAKMFYFFFESRGNKSDDPLLLWITGGPGCGSELALFYENGPVFISPDLTLIWNDYGWDQISNIIFVDQPVGTGFSYTSDYRDLRHDELGVSNDLYDFLQTFLNAHSDYRTHELFVTGESYAGHYIPALVSTIHNLNEQGDNQYINLKGFAIGNGLTQPDIQYEAYGDYAIDNALIGETAYAKIKKRYKVCASSLSMCESEGGGVACAAAYLACNRIFNSVISLMGNTNYYDIRKKCESSSMCYNFSGATIYLNDEEVQEAIGVEDSQQWVACSSSVYDAMMLDWMRNAEKSIPLILNSSNISMLVYAGEYDLVCNWLGNARWVAAMDWTGQEGYNQKNFTSFIVDGEEAGSVKSYGPLTFMKVYDAGHMVPMDQPKAALEMIRRWTRGLSLEDEEGGGYTAKNTDFQDLIPLRSS